MRFSRSGIIRLLVSGIFVFLTVMRVNGQVSKTQVLIQLPDSLRPLTIENFYAQVIRFHPIAKQSELLNEMARQEIRLARGNFDPKLEASYKTKSYDDKEYYELFSGSIKIPTILPFDPSVGVEQNQGQYLNPENYISSQYDFRQFYTGISMPLGQGLITDQRRAALQQAELFGQLMQAEQVKMINKLLLEAAKDYWQWCFAFYNYRLYNQSVSIASEIFRRVKMNSQLGEAAPIDTIQAKITLQQRLVERQEAFTDFQNSGIQLSTYLWDSVGNPLDLAIQYAPVLSRDLLAISKEELQELVNLARKNHPELLKLDVKLDQLEVDRRLAREFLKPRLDVSYYLLNQPFTPEGNSAFQPDENYKLGVDFSFPLFLRKERAKLAQTKVKISSTGIERSYTERQIINQVNAGFNELTNNTSIITLQSDMVEGYERILEAELLNLENGESDLFKINIQQEKLIESQTKLIKLLSDYEKQKAFLYWAAGTRRL